MKVTRRSLSAIVLSGALALAFAGPTMAAKPDRAGQLGGAAGLVAAVVQVLVQTDDINIANNSLNNLLRNADIDVLNNILNNLLRDADIDITRVISDNNVVVTVLSGGFAVGDITVTP